jgi:galactose mutarotase-like enzyme
MSTRIAIASAALSAEINPLGAELSSLKDSAGRELLWQAGPEWPRHAPILFPIVGRLRQDTLWVGDTPFAMGQHGFARDHAFTLVEQEAASCRLLLADSEATRAAYPFPFRLDVEHAVHGASFASTYAITNPGEGLLPCSIGAHPAFRWPLPGAGSKPAHRLDFEQDETAPCYRPGAEGLLDPTPQALPLNGRSIGLREELFQAGALVLLAPASRRVTYTAPGGPSLEVAWQGFVQLGIWMKPGADFLCIEPWAGHADVAGYETDAWNKPGMMMLAPGETRRFTWRVTVTPAPPA